MACSSFIERAACSECSTHTASADVYLIISSGSQCDDDEISSNTRYANFGASPSTYIPRINPYLRRHLHVLVTANK